jgi:hypothetical protein
MILFPIVLNAIQSITSIWNVCVCILYTYVIFFLSHWICFRVLCWFNHFLYGVINCRTIFKISSNYEKSHLFVPQYDIILLSILCYDVMVYIIIPNLYEISNFVEHFMNCFYILALREPCIFIAGFVSSSECLSFSITMDWTLNITYCKKKNNHFICYNCSLHVWIFVL